MDQKCLLLNRVHTDKTIHRNVTKHKGRIWKCRLCVVMTFWSILSPKVCYASHTGFEVSWRHTQAQYRNQRETHQSPYLLTGRQLRGRNDRVNLWLRPFMSDTHFAVSAQWEETVEGLSCNVSLTGGMIFWYFIDVFVLCAPPQEVSGRWTDTSVGGRHERLNLTCSWWMVSLK